MENYEYSEEYDRHFKKTSNTPLLKAIELLEDTEENLRSEANCYPHICKENVIENADDIALAMKLLKKMATAFYGNDY